MHVVMLDGVEYAGKRIIALKDENQRELFGHDNEEEVPPWLVLLRRRICLLQLELLTRILTLTLIEF